MLQEDEINISNSLYKCSLHSPVYINKTRLLINAWPRTEADIKLEHDDMEIKWAILHGRLKLKADCNNISRRYAMY
jgi:hypothetical protein